MTKAIIILKSGEIKDVVITDDEESFYKICGFRKSDGFEIKAEWKTKVKIEKGTKKKFFIELWARDSGKANTENKYDFPPPVDSDLFFGNCLILNRDSEGNLDDICGKEWKKVYEKLFGGFEDLVDTAVADENEIDELEDVPAHMKTKEGYLKDNFVVGNKEDSEDNANEQVSDEEETELEDDEDSSDEDSEEGEESDEEGEESDEEGEDSDEDSDDDTTNSELEVEDYEYSSEEDKPDIII